MNASSLEDQALARCPWRDTDHLGERRSNYCVWCDGFVQALKQFEEVDLDEVATSASERGILLETVFQGERLYRLVAPRQEAAT